MKINETKMKQAQECLEKNWYGIINMEHMKYKDKEYIDAYNELSTATANMLEDDNLLAKAIASIIRNQMEDFHCKYLTDEQMKELNPIIRNSIYSALQLIRQDPMMLYVYAKMYVPTYWEDCEKIQI